MLAACLLTPLHSMAVGALFGIASMYKAAAYYVLPEAGKATCSIGVSGFKYPAEVPPLMNETDSALYEAENSGRACYVIKETV